jgi:hypothetical protein
LPNRRPFVRLYAPGEPPDAYPDGIKPGPDGNFDVGEYSAGNIPVVTADGKLVRKHTPTTDLASPRRWAVKNPSGR